MREVLEKINGLVNELETKLQNADKAMTKVENKAKTLDIMQSKLSAQAKDLNALGVKYKTYGDFEEKVEVFKAEKCRYEIKLQNAKEQEDINNDIFRQLSAEKKEFEKIQAVFKRKIRDFKEAQAELVNEKKKVASMFNTYGKIK